MWQIDQMDKNPSGEVEDPILIARHEPIKDYFKSLEMRAWRTSEIDDAHRSVNYHVHDESNEGS